MNDAVQGGSLCYLSPEVHVQPDRSVNTAETEWRKSDLVAASVSVCRYINRPKIIFKLLAKQ